MRDKNAPFGVKLKTPPIFWALRTEIFIDPKESRVCLGVRAANSKIHSLRVEWILQIDHTCIVTIVEWNKPLYTPIPVSKYDTKKHLRSHPIRPVDSNIITVTRINRIEYMRLKVTALPDFMIVLLYKSISLVILLPV
jgi:hypothetical protein